MDLHLQQLYYIAGGASFLAVFVRIVYTWFRDFDNAQRFTTDMARVQLPYIHNCLFLIAKKLDLDLDIPPPVNFTYTKSEKSPD